MPVRNAPITVENVRDNWGTPDDLHRTVVFADLTGSMAIFESMGNLRGAALVTMVTKWLCEMCVLHQGEVVKVLGDGVLMTFGQVQPAIDMAIAIQRNNGSYLVPSPLSLPTPPTPRPSIRIGIAYGRIIQRKNACHGDAVNVATGLCDLAGPDQVWVDDSAAHLIADHGSLHLRPMGRVTVEGRGATCSVHLLVWQTDVTTAFLTMQSPLAESQPDESQLAGHRLRLHFSNTEFEFRKKDLPIFLGRDKACDLAIPDRRVSRVHATIEWRGGTFSLRDESTYGTWVRFVESDATVALRRKHCPLHGRGEIALGVAFDRGDAPTVTFAFSGQ
jgi:class 3 adenylate cyclase